MAIAPSPAAVATRLIERWRTSPAAKGARDRGLQVVGRTLQRPGGRGLAVGQEVGTGDEVATWIADDGGVGGPIGVGAAADGDQQLRCGRPFGFLRRSCADSDA